MNLQEAQAVLKSKLSSSPDLVIEKLLAINEYKATTTLVELDKVGPRNAGAAQLVMKAVLQDSDREASVARLIAFAESFK